MFTNVYQKKLSGFCLFFIGALTACDGAKTALTEEWVIC